MNLPNAISLARLLAVPVTLYLILQSAYGAAFWLFVAAGLSDAVDGYIAKRFNQMSQLGSFLDPIADKFLLVGVYITLGHAGHLPSWLVILVVSRDVLIVGAVLLLLVLGGETRMRPHVASKFNTACQIALAAAVLAQLGIGLDLGGAGGWLVYLVGATTLLSGAVYVVSWVGHLASAEKQS